MSSSTGRPHYFLKQGPSLNSSLARVATQQALELPISAPSAGNTDTCSSPWLSWRCWWSNFKSSYFHNKLDIHLPSNPHPSPKHKLWSSGIIRSACNHWVISLYPVPYGEWERTAMHPSLQCTCTWSNFHLSLTSGGGVPGIHHLVYLLVQVTLLLYKAGQRMKVPWGIRGEMRGEN